MNKYLLVDLENNYISNLNKVESDFQENDIQTSSITCKDKIDLFNTLLEQVKEMIEVYAEENDIRVCTECGHLMDEGYCIENGIEYYCSEECLHKHISEEEFEELYDNGNGDSYWTEWE